MQTPYSLIDDICLRMKDYPLVALSEWSSDFSNIAGFPFSRGLGVEVALERLLAFSGPAPVAVADPLVVLHLHGYHGTYHLYLTGLNADAGLASGYEASFESSVSDGARLFLMNFLDIVPKEWWLFKRPIVSIDKSFQPMRASELFGPR